MTSAELGITLIEDVDKSPTAAAASSSTSESPSKQTAPSLSVEEEILEDIISKVRDSRRKGVPLRNVRVSLFVTHRHCFTGLDLLKWLKENYPALHPKRQDLLSRIQELIEQGVIRCISNEKVTNVLHIKEDSELQSLHFAFTKAYRKRIVVIGGGFAGAKVCKLLEKTDLYNVTMIDAKPYFESLPSVPSVCGNAENVQRMRASHEKYLKNTEIIVGRVLSVTDTRITIDNGIVIENFDYCILATGSNYDLSVLNYSRSSVSKKQAIIINGMNVADIIKYAKEIAAAKSITIIGGGPVGVEIGGELAHRYSNKKINIVSFRHRLLERCCTSAHTSVVNHFKSYSNVSLMLGENVEKICDDVVHMSTGKKIQSDIIFACTGFHPNTKFLQHHSSSAIAVRSARQRSLSGETIRRTPTVAVAITTPRGTSTTNNLLDNIASTSAPSKLGTSALAGREVDKSPILVPEDSKQGSVSVPASTIPLTNKGFIMVAPTLQVKGSEHIYAAGDIVDIREEKLAQCAESHASIVVENIGRAETRQSLRDYLSVTRPIFVSLGPKNSIFIYGKKVITEGWVTSIVKRLVEYKIMSGF